ncbi:MAG: hypothetical protein JSR66_19650 [Proteobacteria bacterium]|nr:hypothetical protein [Pseudomonadota bacterium]
MDAAISQSPRANRLPLAVAALFLCLVTFAFGGPYLLGVGQPPPVSVPSILVLHGMAMGGWVVLLAVQSSLVQFRRVAWHRRLGWFGSGWALITVTMGCTATIFAAHRDVQAHQPWAHVKVGIMLLECTQMLLFLGCIVLAVLWRRRPDRHQRFMILTALCMWPSVVSRLPGIGSPHAIMMALDVALVALLVTDTLRNHRLHPVYLWGCLTIGVVMHLVYVVALSPWWADTSMPWLS